ncbi:pyrophosphatase [Brevundimonas sp. Root1423]|nr:pyrophosphatase [Brevundimonas sp. Root1423]
MMLPGSVSISDYSSLVEPTDILAADLPPVLQGLFGEVGGIMSAAKKLVREGPAFPGYLKAAEEEFGDALWYLAALCRRMGLLLEDVLREASGGDGFTPIGVASDLSGGGFADVRAASSSRHFDSALFDLAGTAGSLMSDTPSRDAVVQFARAYLQCIGIAKLSFARVATANVTKTRGAFLEPDEATLPDFDASFRVEEQLPREFAIRVSQRHGSRSYLQWNGVFIGDPLTDNIVDNDGYRFHDVFHFANAAILHWSPVMRAIIRHKRKSDPLVDENQDSGRAIVVEEGVSAWLFSRAKELNFFEGQTRVSLGLTKTIGEFVQGYEVQACPLKLWEKAILEGYRVFRELKVNDGGWVVGNRTTRSIEYQPLDWSPSDA